VNEEKGWSALKVSGAMEVPEVRNPRRFEMNIAVEEEAQDQAGIQVLQDKPKVRRPPRKPDGLTQEEKLKAERVQERLRQEASAWRLINGGTGINRTREFPDVRVAMSYVSYVSVLASCMRLPVTVLLNGSRAVISLQGRRKGKRRGVTDAMVDIAAAIG
jgi:pterin-4a-carbinolamine dehydratase